LISSSGDQSINLWNIENEKMIHKLKGHESDVNSISMSSGQIIASGSCDFSIRLWDVRLEDLCVMTIKHHQSDVNKVKWLEGNPWLIYSGSEDSKIKISDIRRPENELCQLRDQEESKGITALAPSFTGKIVFAGYSNGTVRAWDVIQSKIISSFSAAEKRVTALEMSPDGKALACADWESKIGIWA
jgi:guanine nucleotide-binding protein G(I)/G(S)/G(T) subunit beta-1